MTIKEITVKKDAKLTHALAVRDYVVSVIDKEGSAFDKLKFFFGNFEAEYGHNVARMGLAKAVREYLLGLPSSINCEFTYYEIEKLLVKWEYLTEKDVESQTVAKQAFVEKELDNYWNYLAVGLITLARRNKIIA